MDSHVLTITGFPRTGSTLVWQIARQIIIDKRSPIYTVKNCIARSHTYACPGKMLDKNVIVCIRDPRDAILSFSKLRNEAGKPLNINDWLKFLADAIRMYKQRDIEGYHILRYEFFHPHNLMQLYEVISDILQAEYDFQYGQYLIFDKFSLQNAVKQSQELGNFSKINDDMLHGQHVTNMGMVGGWKYHEDNPLVQQVTPFIGELGYE